jgi:tetratricopeptide (TPR) repeat protein
MLGWTYINMAGSGTLSPEEASRLARDATERALALDDSRAHAHAQLAFQKMVYDWDWAGAEAELHKARALDPRDIAVIVTTAQLKSVQGRLEDASELLRQYLEIDPLNKLVLLSSALNFWADGRLDEALANARMLLEIDAKREGAHALVAQVLLAQNENRYSSSGAPAGEFATIPPVRTRAGLSRARTEGRVRWGLGRVCETEGRFGLPDCVPSCVPR